jgi:hypothetical protein
LGAGATSSARRHGIPQVVAVADVGRLKVLRAAKFKELYGGAYPDEAETEQSALRNIVSAVRSELIL